MSAPSPCPDVRQLQRLLLGRLSDPDADQLERHLSQCARCATSLPKLTAEDALIEAMRTAAEPPLEATDRAVIEVLRRRFKELPAERAPSPAASEGTSEMNLLGRLGDYQLGRMLGAGGMGVVFQAEDARLKRFVALKVMKPALAAKITARERFLREARVMAALRHDHIVTIHQVGESGGVPFLAMELLEGETLEQRLQRQRRDGQPAPLPLDEVVRIGREIADGLAAAHERGLIHRDIKPANIWLEARQARVKLLDFGLAHAEEQDTLLTQSGEILGTPGYMAPEQARGKAAEPSSDLFSLGCVLYRMTTGRPPFQGDSTSALLLAVAGDKPTPPHVLNPELPAALSTLIGRLLSKDPADRPASARTVAEMLTALSPASSVIAPLHRRSRWSLILGMSAILGILLAVALVLLRTARPAIRDRPLEPDKPVSVRRPSPLDRLSGESIPASVRFDGQPDELVSVLGEPGSPVSRLTFAPDGGRLLTARIMASPRGGEETWMALWDIETGRVIRHYEDSTRSLFSLTFSPDGRRFLMTSEPGPPILRDTYTGKELARLEGAGDCVYCAAFAPDGRTLVTGDRRDRQDHPGCVRWWDAQTGEQKRCLRGHAYHVGQVAFLPDGRHIVSGSHGSDCTVRLWDLTTGREERRFEVGLSGVGSLAISADGRRVAVGVGGGRVRVWDLESNEGHSWRELTGHTGTVVALCFGPDGLLTTVANDYRLIRYDLTSGTAVLHRKLAGTVGGVAFAPDRRHLAVANPNGTIFFFRLSPP